MSFGARHAARQQPLRLGIGILHADAEHEAVQLRGGQRIGALHVDRILRRQHEERLRQRVAVPHRRDLPLLHGLHQRGLRLRRRAVDLVGEDQVGEDRPGEETEAAAAAPGVRDQHFGAGDVGGHQVRRELDAREAEVQQLREGGDEQGLGHPRDAYEQRVVAGQDAEQDLLDHLLHPDHALAERLPDARCGLFPAAQGATSPRRRPSWAACPAAGVSCTTRS